MNYRRERIVFDVAEIPLPYNGILGHLALAKYMAASHYAYNMLKMPGPMNIITFTSEKKDALIRTDQLYREAVAAAAVKAPAPAAEGPGGKKKAGKTSRTHSGKRTSSECCVGYWVPAKPLRFELWGAHEDLLPTDPRPNALS